MEWWLFTFLLGAILSLFLPIVPALIHVVLAFILGALLFYSPKTRKFSGVFFGIAVVLNAGAEYETQKQYIIKQVSKQNTGKSTKVRIQGVVTSLVSDHKVNMRVSHVNASPLDKPATVRLSWRNAPKSLAQGQVWRLAVGIKPSHGFANIGGFSYQTWLRHKDIVATGYVVKSKGNKCLKCDASFRQTLYNQLNTLLGTHEFKGILLALSLGERSQITDKQWQALRKSGTQHLVAISGLHLGLIATGSFLLCLLFIRLLPLHLNIFKPYVSRLQLLNIRVLAIVFSCLFALYYAFLAGFSVPTQRALVMLFLFWGAKLLGWQLGTARWLLIALTLIILAAPLSLISASFWLSFYAVVVIFLIVWRYSSQLMSENRFKHWLISLVVLQFSLSLLMMPISAFLSQQISLSALFANLIAVPFLSFTTIPLCLLAVILLPISSSFSYALFQLAGSALKWLWGWLTFVTDTSWAVIELSNAQSLLLSLLLFYFVFSYLASISLKYSRRGVSVSAISALLVLFSYVILSGKEPRWQLSIADVGQGLSIFLEQQQQVIIYDVGPAYPSGFNVADAVLIPYLQAQGHKDVAQVIISHSDNDHAGALGALKKKFPVKTLIANDSKLNGTGVCRKGDTFEWQALRFNVLWPREVKGEKNDDSCVIHVSDGQFSALLSGDISLKVEQALLSDPTIKAQLKADVLIAPHHGSKTSSSMAFIRAVSPRSVVFSSGFLNRWKMPHDEVVSRYQQAGIESFTTGTDGMVRFKFYHQNFEARSYREDVWSYWFAN